MRWRTAVTRTARNLARRVSRRVSVSRMVLFHTRCVCVCKLSLWTMRASRNLACLVGRTQASEFLFSTRKLGPKFKMGSPPLCEYTFSSSSSSSSSSSDSATQTSDALLALEAPADTERVWRTDKREERREIPHGTTRHAIIVSCTDHTP